MDGPYFKRNFKKREGFSDAALPPKFRRSASRCDRTLKSHWSSVCIRSCILRDAEVTVAARVTKSGPLRAAWP